MDTRRARYESALDRAFWAVMRAINAAEELGEAAAQEQLTRGLEDIALLEQESLNRGVKPLRGATAGSPKLRSHSPRSSR
jgi:hypothetical protein